MKLDFVVLRAGGTSADILANDSDATGLPLADLQVETHSMEPADLRDIARDPAALAIAPAMPVRLVAPVASKSVDAASLDDGDVAWGLDAMHVSTSPYTGKGVTVAVLDTGIDKTHEAFAGRTIEEEDFTGEGNGDMEGHGTHCAGTIFGADVSGVRIGVARGIRKALIGKVLDKNGSGSTEGIVRGILWAAQRGANVISMSLGFDFPGMVNRLTQKDLDIEPATSIALKAYRENVRLFDQLASLLYAQSAMFTKTILIAAAGNESDRPRYEIATAPPATADGIVSVGAIGRRSADRFDVAPFSNALPDVAGPGVDIRSAKRGGGLTSLNGTSMATPHVTGVAALWFERLQEDSSKFKVSEVVARLLGNASRRGFSGATDRANVGAGLALAPQ